MSIQSLAARVHVPEDQVLSYVQKQPGLEKATAQTEIDPSTHLDLFSKLGETFHFNPTTFEPLTLVPGKASPSYGQIGGSKEGAKSVGEMPADLGLELSLLSEAPKATLNAKALANGASLADALAPSQKALVSFDHARLLPKDWLDKGKLTTLAKAAIAGTDDGAFAKVSQAIEAYVSPGFAFSDDGAKQACIDTLKNIATKDGGPALERFHLPRASTFSKEGSVIRYSIEQEGTNDKIWDWYGPKNGTLAKDFMNEKFLGDLATHMAPGKTPPSNYATLSTDAKAAWVNTHLRWDDLTQKGRHAFLASELEVKGALSLLERRPGAPEHMTEKLVWEVAGPLKVWEIMTKKSYTSLDQLYHAMDEVNGFTKTPGFHVHVTFEPKSKNRLKPAEAKALNAVIGLIDLDIFASHAAITRAPFTHKFLQVFNGETLGKATNALSTPIGQPEKYHNVGVRTGLYDPFSTVGFEVRGHLGASDKMGHNIALWGQSAELISDALTGSKFEELSYDGTGAFSFPSTTQGAAELCASLCTTSKTKAPAIQSLFDKAKRDGNPFDYRAAAPMLQWEHSPFMSAVPEALAPKVSENIQAVRKDVAEKIGDLAKRAAKTNDRAKWVEISDSLQKILQQGMQQIMQGPPEEMGLDAHRLVYMSRVVGEARGAE